MASQAINKDIMEWDAFPNYDILYTDPPWGERMVKWFATAQKKATGVTITHTLEDILSHLAKLADKNKPLIVEYAVKDWAIVIELMQKHGHTFYRKFERIQSMGRPFVLLVFNCNLEFEPDTTGFATVSEAVTKLGAKTVFDPFAGIGLTAKAVHRAGASYIGSEMNKARFAKLKAVVDSNANL